MAQVAGHVTHARNLRDVIDRDPTVDATWCDIAYHRDGGRIERLADVVGRGMALRPVVEVRGALRGREFDVLFTNSSAADVVRRPFVATPSLVEFDVTPIQLAALPWYGRDLGSRPLAALRRHRKRRLWNGVEQLQAWSQWAKASAVDDYGVDPDKVIVNPPGVDLHRWSPAPRRCGRDGPTRVLFVGGDFVRKGGDTLVDWFGRARPADTELHVVTRATVAVPAGVFVHTDIEPNSPHLIELYRSSDVFVLPSRAECFGMATVEAMAAGLPVVVTDVGASREIVDHGSNGYVVGVDRPDELADALGDLLDDADRRAAMGLESRRIAEQRFDLEASARRTVRSLEALATGLRPENAWNGDGVRARS